MESENFIFQAWKVMEFYGQSLEVMENYIIIDGRLILAVVKAMI